ncbi:MAG: hypothetical protein ACRD2A_19775, partial [Vicinamibacterales bacterium]
MKARDLAGNEDSTPAAQNFSVGGLTIRITEPLDGALITTPSVWIKGIVENGGPEVAVTVPLPPGAAIPSLAASTEAGTFAVEVPVSGSTTSVTVTATDAGSGATASHQVTVNVQ